MSIQILPTRLANQIAAGEVVERPASVVKELVENSIDAGADRIEIDIEKGGQRLIRVRDNGAGIAGEELTLALSRHATSKIATLDDLERIMSMGFRGEALASISSVSRLTLTSKTVDADSAWAAQAEGREMNVQITPAAHPQGTTVEVHDLFFNTPARRKFLRAEKTEFAHIDDVVRRIALGQPGVSLVLRHNQKTLRQYPAASGDGRNRLAAVFGQQQCQQLLAIDNQHRELRLHGWVAQAPRQHPDMQYCYVNGRMMKDKVINHAVREAFGNQLLDGLHGGFVLYLTLPPEQVDVNVHPAKHEVRFHDARLVHDFIVKALQDVLAPCQEQQQPTWQGSDYPNARPRASTGYGPSTGAPANRHQVQEALADFARWQASSQATEIPEQTSIEPASGQPMHLEQGRYLVVSWQQQLVAVDLWPLAAAEQINRLQQNAPAQPLLLPVTVSVGPELSQLLQNDPHWPREHGMELHVPTDGKVMVKAVPAPLRELDVSQWLPVWLTHRDDPWPALSTLLGQLPRKLRWAEAMTLWHNLDDDQRQQAARALPLASWLEQQP